MDNEKAQATQARGDMVLRRKKALYRAEHRGTKEMDWLLGRYARARIAAMGNDDLAAFEQFLAMPDPELQSWILDDGPCPHKEFVALVGDMRAFHNLTQSGE